jgi:hypothetical protein
METSLINVLGTICFAGSVVVGMVCAIILTVNQYRAACHRKPGESFMSCFQLLVVVFCPGRYTDVGLRARAWCIRGLVGFFVAMILGLATGHFTHVAH